MVNKFFIIKQFLLSLIRIFYSWLQGGQNCVVCGKNTLCLPVCYSCRLKYFSVDKALAINRCCYCGRELISSYESCPKCRENRVLYNTDKVIPLFSYRLWNKELLFKWKISGERNLSGFYADLVHVALKKIQINDIVPVPPRKGKIQENGWDQIDELCQFLEKKYNFNLLKLLYRNSTKQQKKLNRQERLNTIQNAYSLAKYDRQLPDRVCLIDDVCTTGSTIECCARLLKTAGIKEVYVVTLYIVD